MFSYALRGLLTKLGGGFDSCTRSTNALISELTNFNVSEGDRLSSITTWQPAKRLPREFLRKLIDEPFPCHRCSIALGQRGVTRKGHFACRAVQNDAFGRTSYDRSS